MANKYLDLTGVGKLWELIKTADDKVKTDLETLINGIKATSGSSVEYDTENKWIYLKDADGNTIENSGFSASEFVKDGVLQSVEIITATEGAFFYDGKEVNADEKFIKFTWNTDAGAGVEDKDSVSNVTYLKVSEIAPVYTGTGGIVVNNSNEISIDKVDATKTKLTGSITIAGGPLANHVDEIGDEWPWKDDANNNIIPSGKSMEEILTRLFLKETNGTVTFGTVAWSKSLTNPTVKLSSDGPVEVGSIVKLSSVAAGTATSGKRNITLTTTEGFFDDDTYDSSKSKTYYGTSSSVTGTAVYSYVWNDAAISDFVINSTELRIKEGENKIKVTQSGQTAVASGVPAKTVYASTNTKVKLPDNIAQFDGEDAEYTAPLSSTGTDTITGGYYAFVDYTDTIPVTSTEVRALTGKARIGKGNVGTTNTEYKITKNYMIVAVPTGWDFTIQNSLGQADQRNSFEKTSSELPISLPDGSTKKYDVYTIGWKDGVYKNLVIK